MTAWRGDHRDDRALRTTGKIPVWTAKVCSSEIFFSDLLPEHIGRGTHWHLPVFEGWDCALNQVTKESKPKTRIAKNVLNTWSPETLFLKNRYFLRMPRVTLLKNLPWSCKSYHRFTGSHSIAPTVAGRLKQQRVYHLWCESTGSKM